MAPRCAARTACTATGVVPRGLSTTRVTARLVEGLRALVLPEPAVTYTLVIRHGSAVPHTHVPGQQRTDWGKDSLNFREKGALV